MSPSGLDRIARELAAGEISRRSALKRLAGAGLGLGVVVAPAGVAEAMAGGCPPGRKKCDGKCCPKNARCLNGKCKCKPGFKKCGRKCVDTQTSVKHCGACGNTCDAGQVCLEGECVTQVCSPGQTQPCYTGPPGTQGVGVCHGGTQTCNQSGTAYGSCQGEVTPSTEICGSGVDEDCDGQVDDGCCTPDPPATTCAGRMCGTVNNNCGQPVNCGSCSGAETCTPEGQCEPPEDLCEGVVCTQQDQCHDVGVCDPETGSCSNPEKQDGSPCNDGDACTQSDTCQAGVCVGSFPVVCQPQSECHNAGTCNPVTGQCSNPTKPNGALCSIGTCQNGTCTPV